MTAFSIAIPQRIPSSGFSAPRLRDYLQEAEALGFEGVWTQEQPLGTAPQLSPLEALTFAAAHTSTLRLGCAVFVTPLHQPVQLAKALTSLDHISGGRVEAGVGIGGKRRQFAAFGITDERLATRFTEGVMAMKELWTCERASFSGDFYRLDGAAMEPKPVQKPHPPLWFGGGARPALRRAARLGNGFMGAGAMPTSAFAEQAPVVRAALAEHGRDPGTFRMAKRVYLALDDDEARGWKRIGEALGDIYPYRPADYLRMLPVVGGPGKVAAGLAEVLDAGAEMLLLNPLWDHAGQLRRLAADVLPRLR